MHVRPAQGSDVEDMVAVIVEVAPEGSLGVEPPIDEPDALARFIELVGSDGPEAAWVLEDEGEVVGYAAVRPRPGGVLSLAMALRRPARGRGGGRMLLEVSEAHARELGVHKLELEVWTDNARAITLYARGGYEVEGLRRDHYRRRDGTLRSTLIMARRLLS
jgi:putative acetyltransferase